MSGITPAAGHADGRSDFDFIFGRWQVRNRKLADVADPGCTEWVTFGAIAHAEPVFGGLGHIDRIWADAPPSGDPFEGLTLRQFDPQRRVWRIWWASSSRPGHLDPPVEGCWANGRGTFFCDDTLNDRQVNVRFEWTNETSATARWEQAFSWDNGLTWQVNWIMELTRAK